MDINVNMQFQCTKCNTIIKHNYTQDDVLSKSYLELTCQKCGNYQEVSTSNIIEKAKEEAIAEIKRNFKTI